jgi:hypothetical protein
MWAATLEYGDPPQLRQSAGFSRTFLALFHLVASAAILFYGVSVVIQMVEGPRLLYTRIEAARQLSISVRSLDYLIALKQLATRRVGKRVMIPHNELIRFAKADHFMPITKAA